MEHLKRVMIFVPFARPTVKDSMILVSFPAATDVREQFSEVRLHFFAGPSPRPRESKKDTIREVVETRLK
jgi:hypothetical protein